MKREMHNTTQREALLSLLLLFLLWAGCAEKPRKEEPVQKPRHKECNAMYYWRTVYKLSGGEAFFLRLFHVGRMYVRFFDVVMDVNPLTAEWDAVPNATIRFQATPDSSLEIVPTVFITLEALKWMKGSEGEYATKIADRIFAMMSAHRIKKVKEVQLDCDWTKSTEESYFRLCREVRERFRHLLIEVSATIRLHQLRRPAPPVDRGVLMLYNTGNIRSSKEENSILSHEAVRPYLRRKVTYGLHLDVAYPTFGWGVWFRGETFKAILDRERVSGYLEAGWLRSEEGGGAYVAVADFYDPALSASFAKGDRIRIEQPSFREIMRVKRLTEGQLEAEPRSCILYHLDSSNLSDYSYDEIFDMFGAE